MTLGHNKNCSPSCEGDHPPGEDVCPECRVLKCANCDSTSWDNERDERVPCPCAHAGHDTRIVHMLQPNEFCVLCASGEHRRG